MMWSLQIDSDQEKVGLFVRVQSILSMCADNTFEKCYFAVKTNVEMCWTRN